MNDKLAKLSPLLFTIFGLVLLSFVTWKQFQVPRPMPVLIIQVFMILIYVGYMAFESKISIKEIDKQTGHDHDKHTMELAAVIKISLLFSCLGLGNTLIPEDSYLLVASIGIFMSILGFVTRGTSILNLGPHYGHRIRPIGTQLHEEGMYSIIRHGAYSGTFFIHLGVTIVFLNLVSAVLIFAWLAVVIIRIQLEERLLMQDDRYKKYALKTKYKMIPYIW
jgi:protein-S-isoprenylcysteine O-methyltransferase Ste14